MIRILLEVLVLYTVLLSVCGEDEWTPIVKGQREDLNFEENSLEVETEGNGLLAMSWLDGGDPAAPVGTIYFSLASAPLVLYQVVYCTIGQPSFTLVDLRDVRTWTFTRSKESLNVTSNGQDVLYLEFEKDCTAPGWQLFWGLTPAVLQFDSVDSATDRYRAIAGSATDTEGGNEGEDQDDKGDSADDNGDSADDNDGEDTKENEVLFHIRGPKPQYSVIGGGSSITCSVAAPEKDETFMMTINGDEWNGEALNKSWSGAGFIFSDFDHENGTIETSIAGYIDSFTESDNMTEIRCFSKEYDGEISMTIELRDNHDDCHFPEFIPGGFKIWEHESVSGYQCYHPFVMTPNMDMMMGHMWVENVNASQAYMDLYNLAFCNMTMGAIYLPECRDRHEVPHCGLPNYIEHGKAVEFMFKDDYSEDDKDDEDHEDKEKPEGDEDDEGKEKPEGDKDDEDTSNPEGEEDDEGKEKPEGDKDDKDTSNPEGEEGDQAIFDTDKESRRRRNVDSNMDAIVDDEKDDEKDAESNEDDGDKEDTDSDWDMMAKMLPTMAKYECEEGYKMMRTTRKEDMSNMGWCRADGSYEIPYCVPMNEYMGLTFSLDKGSDKNFADKSGKPFAGVVSVMSVDAYGNSSDTWQAVCNDGSNNFAAGAICRSLGFNHGEQMQPTKKMLKPSNDDMESGEGDKESGEGDEKPVEDGRINWGWTNFACDYDDTLPQSSSCRATRYEEAKEMMGITATCFNFDKMAIRCFENYFDLQVNVRTKRKNIFCDVKASKGSNRIGLEEFSVRFLLDDEDLEIEPENIKRKKRGFSTVYDLKSAEYSCVSCELYMDGMLVTKRETCKEDSKNGQDE